MQKKILLITLLIVILTGGLAAAGLYIGKQLTQPKEEETTPEQPVVPQETVSEITPAEIDTSDWRTYRNKKYGYEIKYPPNWYIREAHEPVEQFAKVLFLDVGGDKEIAIGGAGPEDYYRLSDIKKGEEVTQWMGVEISSYPKPLNFTWKSWLKDNFPVVTGYKNFIFHDLQCIKVTELQGIFPGNPNIFINNEKAIYNFRLFNNYSSTDTKKQEAGLTVFNQILFTFKFTE